MGRDAQILTAMKTTLQTLPWVKLVNSDKIYLTTSDFNDHEIPLIQIIAGPQSIEHERSDLLVTWILTVELVLKSQSIGLVNQNDLLDKREEIEQAIGANVSLGLPFVTHVRYDSNDPDLHLLEPYYTTSLDFAVLYYKTYIGDC